jgi:hypothetical protein
MQTRFASEIYKRLAKGREMQKGRDKSRPYGGLLCCWLWPAAKKLDVFVFQFQVEALAEALHAASSVQKALLPGIEGMAL